MVTPRQIPFAPNHRPTFPNWVKALLATCALLLQLLLPVGTHPANAGEWMVICGTDGPALMQVQLTDGDPESCPMCDSCQMCSELNSANAVPHGPVGLADRFQSHRKPLIANDVFGANPAQFWPASRGPPLGQIVPFGHYGQHPHAATPNKGAASWT